MGLSKHFGHYFRVALATFFTRIAVWETFQNGFLATHVLLWWAAATVWVIVVTIEAVRVRSSEDAGEEDRR